MLNMSSIQKAFLLFIFLAHFYQLSAQEADIRPEFIPPSPTAASLGKYGDIPVSLHNGTANINIPLYSLPSKTLNIDVSLSYHSSGIKVNEIPSWIGSGWALNAGGVITRVVRGLPDEVIPSGGERKMGGDLPVPPESSEVTNWEIDNWELLKNIEEGYVDTEPDLFYFNFQGFAGKFYFDENYDYHFIPHQNFKILKSPIKDGANEWIIVDGSGVTYYFGRSDNLGVEQTHVFQEPEITITTTAWNIVKVTSPQGDTIDFYYEDKFEKYESTYSESLIWGKEYFYGYSIEEFSDSRASTEIHGESSLKEISTSRGKIIFNSSFDRKDMINGERLRNIEIYDHNDRFLKSFSFHYANESTNYERLTLSRIIEQGREGSSEFPYEFEYYDGLPAIDSKAQDHWGFFNDRAASTLIPQKEYNDHHFTGANREPNAATMHAGTLRKISYPTGGYSVFEYQAHDYYDLGNSNEVISRTHKVVAGQVGETIVPYKEEIFNIPVNGTEVNFTADFLKIKEDFMNDQQPVALLLTSSGDTIRQWSPEPPEQYPDIYEGSLFLDEGDYKLTIEVPCASSASCPDTTTASLEVTFEYEVEGEAVVNKTAGGIRIWKVTNYDGINEKPNSKREFIYEKEIDGRIASSGHLVSKPVYQYKTQRNIYENVHDPYYEPVSCFPVWLTINHLSAQNQSQIGVNQGSHILYTRVVEKFMGEIENNGKIVHDYVFYPRKFYAEYPFPPLSNDITFRNGKPKRTAFYSEDQEFPIKRIDNQYEYKNDTLDPHYNKALALKVAKKAFGISCRYEDGRERVDEFAYKFYNVVTEWNYLHKQTEVEFDQQDSIKNISQYFYDNPDHAQITKVISNSSIENEDLITEYQYAADLDHTLLAGKNMNNIVLEETTFKGLVKTSHKKTDYSNINGFILPTSKQIHPKGGIEMINIDYAYDNSGNLIGLRKEQDIPQAYVWGYNKNLPIAEIMNANADQIFYTSFEDEPAAIKGIGITGEKSWHGTYSVQKPVPSGEYVLSYWEKNGVNGLWETKEISFTTSPMTIGNSNNYIDEIRVLPKNATMVTYAYDPLIGLISSNNQNNLVTYYSYDNLNRLKLIRDHQGNILKKFDYSLYKASKWVDTNETRCQVDDQGVNTGYKEKQQKDINPQSLTYNQSRWLVDEEDLSDCPVPGGNISLSISNITEGIFSLEFNGRYVDIVNEVYNGNFISVKTTDIILSPETYHESYFYSMKINDVPSKSGNITAGELIQLIKLFLFDGDHVSIRLMKSSDQDQPDWTDTGSRRCITDSGGNNTGNQEKLLRDENLYSETYNNTKWVFAGENLNECPIAVDDVITINVKNETAGRMEVALTSWGLSIITDGGETKTIETELSGTTDIRISDISNVGLYRYVILKNGSIVQYGEAMGDKIISSAQFSSGDLVEVTLDLNTSGGN